METVTWLDEQATADTATQMSHSRDSDTQSIGPDVVGRSQSMQMTRHTVNQKHHMLITPHVDHTSAWHEHMHPMLGHEVHAASMSFHIQDFKKV